MVTKIRKRAADALLRQELLGGEANFRTLAEASDRYGQLIAARRCAASPMYSGSIVELSIQPRDMVAMSSPSS